MKKIKVAIVVLIIIAITGLFVLVGVNGKDVKRIKSEKQLLQISKSGYLDSEFSESLKELLTHRAEALYDPFYYSEMLDIFDVFDNSYKKNTRIYDVDYNSGDVDITTTDVEYRVKDGSSNSPETILYNLTDSGNTIGTSTKTSQKDYSKTNIQVENVDEADINKTDGDYIYSISGYQVVITDVKNPNEIKVASRINQSTSIVPEDIILYNNKMVVIYERVPSSYYKNTVVKTYDISSRENPKEIKSFELNQGYYTSRCIGNKLFVIASGKLREDSDSNEEAVDRSYNEDGLKKEIPLKEIQYLPHNLSSILTVVTTEDLDNVNEDIKVSPFLMNVESAYVSENSIYLLSETNNYEKAEKKELLKKLFSFGGTYAFRNAYQNGSTNASSRYTEIYKFSIGKDGKVKYEAKNKVDGQAINQYSMDERNGHFRIATYDMSKGAKITIYDENLKEIGKSDRVGKNEKMYSTRFMGDKVYLVTYKTIDPLFVIDLSDETKPRILGELSIPGYSTYLHPYDENHIIGIGMETEETTRKDSNGRVISTTARVKGMKMALFDISDVRNPKQISQTVIGDSRTTSAILTNPKALLFSKEKELIAIPVNNYTEDFSIDNSDTYEDMVKKYKSRSTSYISEGYIVYKINVQDGFVKKGTITHDYTQTKKYGSSSAKSKLLRGLYIENNLYTVSENQIKVNKLDNLESVSELKLK